MKNLKINEYAYFKTEADYRKSDDLSYSLLKEVDYKPILLVEKPESLYKKHFVLGSLVDCIITEPTEIWNKFLMSEIELPSDVVINIIDAIYLRKTDLFDKEHKDRIVSIIREFKYYNNRNDDSVYKTLIDKGKEYFELLTVADGKSIITPKLYELADIMATAISRNLSLMVMSRDEYDLYYQVKISFEYREMQCKAMLDVVLVDHMAKKVIGIDIKTGYDHPLKFQNNFIKYKYFLQGAHYLNALYSEISKLNRKIDSTYIVDSFKFIYCSTLHPEYPIRFNLSDTWFAHAVMGYVNSMNGVKVIGLDDRIDICRWHRETNFFEVSKEVSENLESEIELVPPQMYFRTKRNKEITISNKIGY